MSGHTPWRKVEGEDAIVDADGQVVVCDNGCDCLNHIVKCVSMHEQLVNALTMAEEALISLGKTGGYNAEDASNWRSEWVFTRWKECQCCLATLKQYEDNND